MSTPSRFIWSRVLAAGGLGTSVLLSAALLHSQSGLAESRAALSIERKDSAQIEAMAAAELDLLQRQHEANLAASERRHTDAIDVLRSRHHIALERAELARLQAVAETELARIEAALLGARLAGKTDDVEGLARLRAVADRVTAHFDAFEARVEVLEQDRRTLQAQLEARDRLLAASKAELIETESLLDKIAAQRDAAQERAHALTRDLTWQEEQWDICADLPRARRDDCADALRAGFLGISDQWTACLETSGARPRVHRAQRDDPALHPHTVLWEHRGDRWWVELCDLSLTDSAG